MPRVIVLNRTERVKLIETNGTVVYSIKKVRNRNQYDVCYATYLNSQKTAISPQKTRCFDAETKAELIEALENK